MTTARQHNTRTARRRDRLLATAATVAFAVTAAGCTTDDKSAPPPPSSAAAPSPSSAPSKAADPLEADRAEVQAAYARYWSVLTAAYAKSDSQGTELKDVVTGSAYAQTERDLASLRRAGQVTVGTPQHSGTSITFKDGQKLKTALITDCVDVSQWKSLDKKTGKEISLPPERLIRYTTTLTAEKWPTGWMILEEKLQGQAC